jgi:UDP-3-O-[3-hydroxymyristoyl] N-acetylglucosamine deacetylase
MIKQRTIAKAVTFTGLGLHSGVKISLTLKPAEENSGLKFTRTDIASAPIISASVETVSATENSTTIGSAPFEIHTVEHLLAALYGMGVNNVMVEVDGPEIPIMDGSSSSFVFLLSEAGIVSQDIDKNILIIKKEVKVQHDGKWAVISPGERLSIDSTIDFSHPLINKQNKIFEFSVEGFIEEISRARTFGLLRDVEYLKERGLIRGGSLDNAVVLDDFKVINPEGLRFGNEFVRHKILDTIGDLALLGHEIAGKVKTYKSGHMIHHLLCQSLLEEPDAFEVVAAKELKEEYLRPLVLPTMLGLEAGR